MVVGSIGYNALIDATPSPQPGETAGGKKVS